MFRSDPVERGTGHYECIVSVNCRRSSQAPKPVGGLQGPGNRSLPPRAITCRCRVAGLFSWTNWEAHGVDAYDATISSCSFIKTTATSVGTTA
ncbi:hypothetical protein POX_a00271 [Penicillium oxalicum]|uniref:hypothetical protein n=1 Tax=Penicillium oxalicum TaxID=69781 RepID=UPI0020B843D3|nr:hypothetical protein POX_a00271 [Penicillium oxalicum]KAI2793687.1 hypothetical protein POX_a00271 [Penicillium oxalicum]